MTINSNGRGSLLPFFISNLYAFTPETNILFSNNRGTFSCRPGSGESVVSANQGTRTFHGSQVYGYSPSKHGEVS